MWKIYWTCWAVGSVFADDSKLYRPVCHLTNPPALQEDLNAVVRWADRWQLTMPTNVRSYTLASRTIIIPIWSGGGTLKDTAAEKGLRFYIDAELKFRKQAAAAVSKASQVMAVMYSLQIFQLLDKSTLPILYKTLVLPHLEYCNIIWGPFNRADQLLVKWVQRRWSIATSSGDPSIMVGRWWQKVVLTTGF